MLLYYLSLSIYFHSPTPLFLFLYSCSAAASFLVYTLPSLHTSLSPLFAPKKIERDLSKRERSAVSETASRTPAIAHTYLYTVIFKMRERARAHAAIRAATTTPHSLIIPTRRRRRRAKQQTTKRKPHHLHFPSCMCASVMCVGIAISSTFYFLLSVL